MDEAQKLSKLRDAWARGGRNRWKGVEGPERSRSLKRARRKQSYKARKSLQDKGKEDSEK